MKNSHEKDKDVFYLLDGKLQRLLEELGFSINPQFTKPLYLRLKHNAVDHDRMGKVVILFYVKWQLSSQYKQNKEYFWEDIDIYYILSIYQSDRSAPPFVCLASDILKYNILLADREPTITVGAFAKKAMSFPSIRLSDILDEHTDQEHSDAYESL